MVVSIMVFIFECQPHTLGQSFPWGRQPVVGKWRTLLPSTTSMTVASLPLSGP